MICGLTRSLLCVVWNDNAVMAGPQQWGGVPELFHQGILEFGNCELADETRFERSGCGFTSCRASL